MNETLIIAEIGVNHNGDLSLAKKMIREAKSCGVDIVKFQTAVLEELVTNNAKKADYQVNNTGNIESQSEMLRKLLLTFDQFVELKKYCDNLNIQFLSTPFDVSSIKFLDELGVKFWKIPSGEITNLPYLREIARTKKDVILSTGMSTIDEIRDALNILDSNKIILLHCNTEYPTPMEDVNLNAMKHLREEFGVEVGYSDHTEGIEVAIAAVALGTTVIEKHFTLDRTMEGPDHKASIEPDELKRMVVSIRNIEKALGQEKKIVTKSEEKNKAIARKSIVAKTEIKVGDIFTKDNITTKRPGSGISPMKWDEIIGTISEKEYNVDDLIEYM